MSKPDLAERSTGDADFRRRKRPAARDGCGIGFANEEWHWMHGMEHDTARTAAIYTKGE